MAGTRPLCVETMDIVTVAASVAFVLSLERLRSYRGRAGKRSAVWYVNGSEALVPACRFDVAACGCPVEWMSAKLFRRVPLRPTVLAACAGSRGSAGSCGR